MKLANLPVRRQRPNDRMLSSARPNHKYAHVPGAYPGSQHQPLSEVSVWRMGSATARA